MWDINTNEDWPTVAAAGWVVPNWSRSNVPSNWTTLPRASYWSHSEVEPGFKGHQKWNACGMQCSKDEEIERRWLVNGEKKEPLSQHPDSVSAWQGSVGEEHFSCGHHCCLHVVG